MVTQVLQTGEFPERYNSFLLRDDETRVNLPQKATLRFCKKKLPFFQQDYYGIPILGGAKVGTLLSPFCRDLFCWRIYLAETGATVVGMEICGTGGKIEEEARNKAVVQLAIGTCPILSWKR